jgi:hypothetical protein
MAEFNRRAFVGASAGALSTLCLPSSVLAATQCVTGQLPGFDPTVLSVDCASRRNFQTFRRSPELIGLAGVVSMTFVRGSKGDYPAGNLFLFPWVKPKGKAKNFSAVMPTNATHFVKAAPIPDSTLPLDEYFCRYVLHVPWTSFIGFQIDEPYDGDDVRRDWFTNADLPDKTKVGIDWTSSNLNPPWFGGSNWIPTSDACGGAAWRQLIIAGIERASIAAC